VWHDSFICVTWLIHMCDMTHSYVVHDSFICNDEINLHHTCDMTHSYMWHDAFISETRPMSMWDRTHLYAGTWLVHLYVARHSFFCDDETNLHHTPDMSHLYVGHDSFICGIWHTHTRDMTHVFVIKTGLFYQYNTALYPLWHVSFVIIIRLFFQYHRSLLSL